MALEYKQRVVGIIVLIAFIALLIPFLFTSGVKKKQQSTSREIDIPTTPIASVNQESIALPTSQDVSNEISTKELSVESQSPQSVFEATTPEEGGAVAANVSAVNTLMAEETNQVQTEPTTNELTEVPVVSKADEGKSAVVGRGKTVKNKGAKAFWSVQVGSFANKARLQKMITNLQKKGYHVYSQKITTSRGPMSRVLVGRETSRAKAMKIANQLRVKFKINGHVVRNKR
ncbi:MAG: SPOR domain-containing protein [Coxiellaceae bacterium]|jgi:cell division septation protein DedD|nr:SPOR domain-containing protein [Coxiellaceae bacterium]